MIHRHIPRSPRVILLVSLFALMQAAATLSLSARVLEVGPSRALTLPSQAAAAARDGDTVLIDAGEYADACRWTANDLVIRGIGGYAHVRDRTTAGKAIWVIQGRNTSVEWIEFSGASVQDRNGAGIRQEGADLTVRHCFFHDNENGILAGDNALSRILIEHSRFARNGYGDGYSHNMYINHVAEFTIRYSFVEAAKVGHNVKSRAFRTFILCNGITSGDGTTSREIDLPNGGLAVVAGNVIVHGSASQNSNLLGYGLEGLSNPIRSLFVTHNTFVTARGAGIFVQIPASGTDTLILHNNIFAGRASVTGGTAAMLDATGNLFAENPADVQFADTVSFDYTPLAASPAVDGGVILGNAWGQPLLPAMEYVHPADARTRVTAGLPDAGALEYRPPVSVIPPATAKAMTIEGPWPQPIRDHAQLRVSDTEGKALEIAVFDMQGRLRHIQWSDNNKPGPATVTIDVTALGPGLYYCVIANGNASRHRTLVVR